MNKLRHSILFLLLVCSCYITNAQYELKGQVILKSDQSPIEGVEVYFHESQETLLTDKAGRFLFKSISAGQNVITIFALACETLTDTLLITNDIDTIYALEQWNFNLDELSIVARKQELFGIKHLNDIEGSSIYAGKKTEVIVLDLVKGNLANNIGRQVFAQVTGLNIYEGSEGGLQLNLGGRGLDPNRTSNFNTRQNGYDISADVLGYPESYYTPPSEALSEIRIIRGASSLQYGTQFGGLIDFRTRKIPNFENLNIISNNTIGSFGAFNSFNYVGVNKDKVSVNAFYNYKSGQGSRPNSNYNARNLFASLNYKPSKNTDIGIEYTHYNYLAKQAGGLTDQQFIENPRISTRDRNWFAVNWNLYNLELNHKFNNRSSLNMSLFGLDASRKSVGFRGNPTNLNENPITAIDEQDNQGNYISPRDLIIGNFQNYGAELKSLNKYTVVQKKAVFLAGAKYYKSNNTSIQGPGTTLTNADFNLATSTYPDYVNQSDFKFPNLNLAIFTENIFYINDKLSLIPGLRWEYIKTESVGQYNQVVYDNAGNPIANNTLSDDRLLERNFALLGLGVSYKKSKSLQLIGNVSQNYRSVTFSDIRVASPTFIVDPNIKDERGFTGDLGLKGQIKKYMSYEFTLYSVYYQDRIGIVLDNRANRVRKNIGKALIAGNEGLINLNLAKLINPLQTKFKLNVYVNGAFTFSEYIDSEERNVVGNKVEFVPESNIKSGFTFKVNSFELTYQFSHTSRQFTDAQNSGIAGFGDNKSGIVGDIPAYSISDLTLGYQFKEFGLSIGVNNLWDQAYYTRRATGYPGPGIIPSDPRSYFATFSYKVVR